jgi:hypothetical protein
MTLKRYNEWLFALIATGGTLAVLSAIAWNLLRHDSGYVPPGVQVHAAVATTSGAQPAQRIMLCPPIVLRNGEWQYLPVVSILPGSMQNAAVSGYALDGAYAVSYGRSGPNALDACESARDRERSVIFNVLMRRGGTGEQRLLLRMPAVLASLNLPDAQCAQGEGNVPCGMLLWTLFDQDTNRDGVLNARDASRLYASDLAGDHFHALSPEGARVQSWQWDAHADELFFNARRDTNGDGAINDEDSAELLFSHGDPLTVATPVLDPVIRNSLETVLH